MGGTLTYGYTILEYGSAVCTATHFKVYMHITQPISDTNLVWFEVMPQALRDVRLYQFINRYPPVFLRWEGHKPIRIYYPGIWVSWMHCNPFKIADAHHTAHFRKEAI